MNESPFDLERTQDIYEQIPGYPKPAMIPLPAPGDLSSLERIGLKTSRIGNWLVRFALWLSGISNFQKRLPLQLDELLRRYDLRGAYLFAPVVSATLALEDDPRQLTAIERAATLLVGARQFYQDIVTGRLEPDRYRGNILEMGQYLNLFSTCLIIDGKRPRVFKSSNNSRIIVLIKGQQFALELKDPEHWAPTQITRSLAALVELANAEQEVVPAGILTGADHPTQLRIFSQLQRVAANQQALTLLRHSFVILCLDLDHQPSSYTEAAKISHSGNFANRWSHASLQIVVFGNARACMICNFSTTVDGNTMMRAGAEIKRRAASVRFSESGTAISPLSAKKLHWQIEPRFIREAELDLNRIIDHQPATFEIAGVGSNYFSAHGLDGVSIFMIALQMATRQVTGMMVQLRQFLSLSRYRYMGLTDAMVTTPEVIQFITYLDQETMDLKQAKTLLQAAITSQRSVCRRARSCLPLDSLISLYLVSTTKLKRRWAQIVILATMAVLRLLRVLKPLTQREVIVSHPEIYHEVPIVGRPGIRLPYVKYFGLHYQIMADRIIITMMPSVQWNIPNSDFIAELERALKRIQQIIKGTTQ